MEKGRFTMKKEKQKANWANPTTTAENEILPGYLKWAWTSRALSLSMNIVFIMQLTYYCTDMLGMPATLVGTLLLASKIFDGVTDLIVGFIIDRTHSRWGKARPYEIFIVFVWLFTVLMFSAPEMSMVGKSIYIFGLYALINSVCATFLNGGNAVYLARSIRSEKNRVSVMSFNGSILMLSNILFSIILPQMIKTMGTTKAGWTTIALTFGIPLTLIGIMRFIFVKEVVTDEENEKSKNLEKVPLKTSIKCIVNNKYLWILSIITLLIQLTTNIGSSVNNYYFKYIVGDIGLLTVVALGSMVTPIAMALFPVIAKKLGMGKTLRVTAVIGIIGYGIRTIGGKNLGIIALGAVLGQMAILPISMMGVIYLIECMDYGEWKNGVRVEGMVSSINAFFCKLGSGMASGLVGLIMGLAGYDGTLTVQSATTNTAIVALFNWIPLAMMVVYLILSIAYKLDKELPAIRADLAKKRTQA